MVTYHLVKADRNPDLAVLDGYTERTPVGEAIREGTGEYDRRFEARNPAATLSVEVMDALIEGLSSVERNKHDESSETVANARQSESDESNGSAVIDVEGEEDLLALPAIVAAPESTSVVYGQPGEGMVHVPVDTEARERARGLLSRMDGDHERVWELLDVATDCG